MFVVFRIYLTILLVNLLFSVAFKNIFVVTDAMDIEAKSCSFRWEIQNVSQCWWLWNEEGIYSPAFTAKELKSSTWSLCFMPIREARYISFAIKRETDCCSPGYILVVHFRLACLDKNGSIISGGRRSSMEFLQNTSFIFAGFLERERLFVTERELFIPEDTLTVQFTMWAYKDEMPIKTSYIFATTTIKVNRRFSLWKIPIPDTLHFDMIYEFKDKLIDLDLVCCKGLNRFEMKVTSVHDNVKYISCKASVMDSEGKKENFGINKFYFGGSKKEKMSSVLNFPYQLLENKSLYFPNDILSLNFEFVVCTIEHLGWTTNFVKMEFNQKDDDIEDADDNENDQKSDGLEKMNAMRCTWATSKEL